MFKALTPPAYSVDAEAILISSQDPAWPKKQLEEEFELHGKDHPVRRYWRGETRFDLDAPMTMPATGESPATAVRVTDWLGQGEPTKFMIRELDERARRRMMASIRARSSEQAVDAVEFGLVEVRNPDMELHRDERGLLTAKSVKSVAMLRPGLLDEIGTAIWNLSQNERDSAQGKL